MASSLRASSKAVRRQAALLRSCRGTERAPSSARMAVAALSKSLSSGFNHRYHHLHSASSSSGPPRLGRESRAGRFPGTLEKKLTNVLSTSAAAFTSSGAADQDKETADDDGGEPCGDSDAAGGCDFDDPRVAILNAALDHVHEHGFSAVALAAGAKDCGFHSVATGMFPGDGADLVHHVMAKALEAVKGLSVDDADEGERMEDDIYDKEDKEDQAEEASSVGKLRAGIKASLSVINQYKPRWSQAMGIGALPQNAGATAKALAILVDELAFLSGDRSTDVTWYAKRGIIGGIYVSTEFFMLTDESEGLRDTWEFLGRRLADYETLSSTPEKAADVATGVSTVATSLSSAVVSLAGPFLRQASKQVPGGESLVNAAPTAAALASQAFSLAASRLPHAPAAGHTNASTADPTTSAPAGHTPTFPGAPERDPWVNTQSDGGHNATFGSSTVAERLDLEGKGEARDGAGGKFEEELAREERELFGDGRPGGADKEGGR